MVTDGLVVFHGVNDEGDVEGCPADEEGQYEGYDDTDGPLLLHALRATSQPQEDARVTEQHHYCWKSKTQNMVEQTRVQTPIIRVKRNTFYFILSSAVLEVHKEYPVRNGEKNAEEPDHQAATVSHHGLFTRIHLHCIDDGQEAVKADAGKHENPTVEIDLMEKHDNKRLQT